MFSCARCEEKDKMILQLRSEVEYLRSVAFTSYVPREVPIIDMVAAPPEATETPADLFDEA